MRKHLVFGNRHSVQRNKWQQMPASLTALGVEHPDLDRQTAMALQDPSVGGNPVEMTVGNTRAHYEAYL